MVIFLWWEWWRQIPGHPLKKGLLLFVVRGKGLLGNGRWQGGGLPGYHSDQVYKGPEIEPLGSFPGRGRTSASAPPTSAPTSASVPDPASIPVPVLVSAFVPISPAPPSSPAPNAAPAPPSAGTSFPGMAPGSIPCWRGVPVPRADLGASPLPLLPVGRLMRRGLWAPSSHRFGLLSGSLVTSGLGVQLPD